MTRFTDDALVDTSDSSDAWVRTLKTHPQEPEKFFLKKENKILMELSPEIHVSTQIHCSTSSRPVGGAVMFPQKYNTQSQRRKHETCDGNEHTKKSMENVNGTRRWTKTSHSTWWPSIVVSQVAWGQRVQTVHCTHAGESATSSHWLLPSRRSFVSKRTQKVLNRFEWNVQEMLVYGTRNRLNVGGGILELSGSRKYSPSMVDREPMGSGFEVCF